MFGVEYYVSEVEEYDETIFKFVTWYNFKMAAKTAAKSAIQTYLDSCIS